MNQMSSIFERLITELERQGSHYSEPQSFQEYSGITDKTASYISVQDIDDLKPDLRKASYMVFRLGSRPKNRTTHFGLAKLRQNDNWAEYFLIDHDIFKDTEPEIFLPNVSVRQLFAFNLLSQLTENSLINLAISSGLLASALGLESSESLAAPASGHSIFTFNFKVSPDAPIWEHIEGQVEIDALFVGKLNKKETLFVIEAKTSTEFKSLAKHKLVYPILGLRTVIPGSIPIIPVYIRAIKIKGKREIKFYIAICNELNAINNSGLIILNKLEVNYVKHFILIGYND